jgi:ribosome-binding protein aMBF1 (putative translation factor)
MTPRRKKKASKTQIEIAHSKMSVALSSASWEDPKKTEALDKEIAELDKEIARLQALRRPLNDRRNRIVSDKRDEFHRRMNQIVYNAEMEVISLDELVEKTENFIAELPKVK